MANYKMKNMIGEKLGSLEIIGLSETERTKKGTRKWICKCECGKIVYYETRVWNDLKKNGVHVSCGCRKYIDRTGQRLGDYLVLKENTDRINNKKIREWICECQKCGYKRIIKTNDFPKYINYKCPQIRAIETKKYKPLRQILSNIKQRCYDTNVKSYKDYGARGITMCDEWLDKKNGSEKFIKWAFENGYEKGLTIDRIDNSKGYSPDNCRWVDLFVQANNKRNNRVITYNNKTQTLKQWCRELELPYRKTHKRLYMYNWSVERAFSTK